MGTPVVEWDEYAKEVTALAVGGGAVLSGDGKGNMVMLK